MNLPVRLFCCILICVAGYLICVFGNWQIAVAIFLFVWANNIEMDAL